MIRLPEGIFIWATVAVITFALLSLWGYYYIWG
jgi:hypothetical protein